VATSLSFLDSENSKTQNISVHFSIFENSFLGYTKRDSFN